MTWPKILGNMPTGNFQHDSLVLYLLFVYYVSVTLKNFLYIFPITTLLTGITPDEMLVDYGI